jgi:putative membrane protein
MFPCSGFGNGYWWLFPILMIGMMVLCFFIMRGYMGSMMCRPHSRGKDTHDEKAGGSALDILNKRYARGEVDKQEYEEKKKTLTA